MKKLYAAWVKIDETLPSIELKGEYPTKKEARKAAREILNTAKIEVIRVTENKKPIKALATIKSKR